MNPVLLKGLIGVGVLGTTAAASVGGYYWLSAPKTIGDKLNEKELVEPYVKDTENQALWNSRKTAYSSAQETDNKILPKEGITEKKLSDKCQEILKTSLNDNDAENKEAWAKRWCLKNNNEPAS